LVDRVTGRARRQPAPARDAPASKPVFHENWFPREKAEATLAAAELAPREGDCIEVGCWEGRSTVLLANALYPRTLHVIDHFEGDATRPDSHLTTTARERDVQAVFVNNMESLTRGNYVLHVMGWRDFFKTYTGRIGFIHIDGEHTYREVHDNVVVASPHMVPNGVMCGDDYGRRPVRRALRETLGEVSNRKATWWWQAPPASAATSAESDRN
jgi:hypothetical protein